MYVDTIQYFERFGSRIGLERVLSGNSWQFIAWFPGDPLQFTETYNIHNVVQFTQNKMKYSKFVKL